MSNLKLSVAVGPYDRTRALMDGTVRIEGVDAVYLPLSPEEIFFRAFRHAEFDICEASLSSFAVQTSRGTCPYVGVPAFVSRAFRHNAIYVRRDRIKRPEDLKGKRLGTPEFQLTANVWARQILESQHGVKPTDIHWFRGGMIHAGRPEKITFDPPPGLKLDTIPADTTLLSLLEKGELDGFIAPRTPPFSKERHPHLGWLFADPVAAGWDYYDKTGIFPIMHLIGIRRELVASNPWLPAAVLKAFERSKQLTYEAYTDTSASRVTLPFLEEQFKTAREKMGDDYWSYGVEPNRKTLDTFLAFHHQEGLSARRLTVEDLFHPGTFESFKL